VAWFVGSNNRVAGKADRVDGDVVTLATAAGLQIRARTSGAIAAGDTVEAFVRPEAVTLARDEAELAPLEQHNRGTVESLLFDGANSAVLVKEHRASAEFRIALPQTGRFADLRVGEMVSFGFDARRAIAFRAGGHGD
jgi:spermidine/putrescine transport system ATP-binding protein